MLKFRNFIVAEAVLMTIFVYVSSFHCLVPPTFFDAGHAILPYPCSSLLIYTLTTTGMFLILFAAISYLTLFLVIGILNLSAEKHGAADEQ